MLGVLLLSLRSSVRDGVMVLVLMRLILWLCLFSFMVSWIVMVECLGVF